MRRVVIALMILSTAMVIGCKQKTMAINDELQIEDSNSEYKITERVIDNPFDEMIFSPLYYGEEGVYGRLSTTRLGEVKEEEIDVPYLVNAEGEFVVSDIPWLQKKSPEYNSVSEWENGYGIYTEGPYAEDTNYYYRDMENNIKIELNKYEEINSYMEDGDKAIYTRGYKLNQNDKYYVYVYSSMNETETAEDGIYTPYIEKQLAVIIDIYNSKYYTVETKNEESLFALFYYDNEREEIMVLKNDGNISRLEIENDQIVLEKYKEIDLSQYDAKINKDFTGYGTSFINDNIIFPIECEKQASVRQAAYNVYSGNINYIKADKAIAGDIENTDLCIVWADARYLGKISTNGEVKILYKLSDIEEFDDVKAIANKAGNSIFIKKG